MAQRNHEVAIDAGTAAKDGFEVGDAIGVAAGGPDEQFRVIGLVELAASTRSGMRPLPSSTSRRRRPFSTRRAIRLDLGRGDVGRLARRAGPCDRAASAATAEVKTAAELEDAAAKAVAEERQRRPVLPARASAASRSSSAPS